MWREHLPGGKAHTAVESLGFRIADADFEHDHGRAEPPRYGLNFANERDAHTLPPSSGVDDHTFQLNLTAATLDQSAEPNSLASHASDEHVRTCLS